MNDQKQKKNSKICARTFFVLCVHLRKYALAREETRDVILKTQYAI